MKTRREIAEKEGTRNPIFLFQVAELVLTDQDAIYRCSECSCVCDPEKSHQCDPEDPIDDISFQEAKKLGIGKIVWRTEFVFATREEAENYGVSKSYDYGEKNINWRVWCVCAMGTLADILYKRMDEL